MHRKNMTNLFSQILFYIILLIVWQLIYFFGVDIFKIWKSYSFPSPKGVLQVIFELTENGSLIIAILNSIKRLLIGYFIAIVLGSFIGMLIIKINYFQNHLKPLILGIQTLPSICWVPFAILWFGLKESAIIFVIVIGASFSIAISVEQAITSVNPIYIKAAKTMGAKGLKLYTKVIFPASVPNLISGYKQGWSFAWRALMSGEVIFASKGLGQILTMGRELSNINQVMAIILIIIILGAFIDYFIFRKLENRIKIKWGLEI